MLYDYLTLATIVGYLLTAVLYFANAFIKEWFAGNAKNSEVSYDFRYGLLKVCEVNNGTCIDYDVSSGDYNQVFLEFYIIYYSLLVGGGCSIVAALLMLPQTEDKKRTNKYKLYLGLRYASNFFNGVALGCAIWMQVRMFRISFNDGYDSTVDLTYSNMRRTSGYIMSWVSTIVCFIAACLGSYESYKWKEDYKNQSNNNFEMA